MVIRSDYQNYIQKYFSNTIFNYTSAYENPNVTAGYIDYILNTPNISEQYATVLLGTLPHQRYDYYSDSNFNKIKRNVLNELNKMNEALGFFNIASKPTVIRDLVVYDFALLFIGLIFDILLIIFIVVAVLLIYSLLLISVETKTFEFGVMRLVGLTKFGFISLILTQAGMFVMPAVILGFLLSFPAIYFLYSSLFDSSLGYMPSTVPSMFALIMALFVGLLIPLLSSIVPIRRALSTNLNDALDTQRSRGSGVLVTFINKKVVNLVPYLLFGSVAVVFGAIIYYGLPVAMLELNFGLILTIFFMILMGLLLGLVLITVNLQGAIEFILLYLLLFWETKAMKTMLRKNMKAHRRKNQLTAIIYALTLGCIIFLLTSANL